MLAFAGRNGKVTYPHHAFQKAIERWTTEFGLVAKVDSDLRMERSESCRSERGTQLS